MRSDPRVDGNDRRERVDVPGDRSGEPIRGFQVSIPSVIIVLMLALAL